MSNFLGLVVGTQPTASSENSFTAFTSVIPDVDSSFFRRGVFSRHAGFLTIPRTADVTALTEQFDSWLRVHPDVRIWKSICEIHSKSALFVLYISSETSKTHLKEALKSLCIHLKTQKYLQSGCRWINVLDRGVEIE